MLGVGKQSLLMRYVAEQRANVADHKLMNKLFGGVQETFIDKMSPSTLTRHKKPMSKTFSHDFHSFEKDRVDINRD